VQVIDLRDPASASVIASYIGISGNQIEVNQGLAAVSGRLVGTSYGPGFALIEFSDPPSGDEFISDDPDAVHMQFYEESVFDGGTGEYTSPGGIALSGNLVFYTDWVEDTNTDIGEGLHTYIADDLRSGYQFDYVGGLNYTERIRSYGSFVFVMDYTRGLLIYVL
jgi:hypothetical protein